MQAKSVSVDKGSHNNIRVSLSTFLTFILILYLLSPLYNYARVYYELPRMGLNAIIVGSAAICFFLICKHKQKVRLNIYQLILIGLLSLIFLIQILSYPNVLSYSSDAKSIYMHTIFSTVIMTSFMWLIGSHIDDIFLKFSTQRHMKLVIYLTYFLILGLLTVTIINNGINNGTFLHKLSIIPQDEDKGYNYLFLGDSFVLITLLVYAISNKKLKPVIMFLGLLFLFAINSRTSFYAYIIVFIVIGLYNMPKFWKGLFFIFIVLALLYSINLGGLITQAVGKYDYTSYRMFRVLDLENDTSWNARQKLFNMGVEELKSNWFTGNFLGELKRGQGTYVHNWLSFWYAYGIIPFIIFCCLAFTLLIKTYLLWKQDKDNPLILFVFAYSIFTIICIVVARSYVFTEIWFALAAMCKVQSHDILQNMPYGKELI